MERLTKAKIIKDESCSDHTKSVFIASFIEAVKNGEAGFFIIKDDSGNTAVSAFGGPFGLAQVLLTSPEKIAKILDGLISSLKEGDTDVKTS